jgi:hypothetical protein
MYDFKFANHGNLALLTPTSSNAADWCEVHLPSDATRWGEAFVIEPRYASDILEGIVDDGMAIA